MTNRPWLLEEATLEAVRSADYQVAVLPLGATEPHNTHLPYGTDTFEAQAIGKAVCRRAHELGARVVLLPTIPYGTETNMRKLPLAMNLQPSTVFTVLKDLIDSLTGSGIRKVLLLNSHGGNDLKPFLREIAGHTEAQLFLCDWFRMVGDRYAEIFDVPEDHAGEMETSLGLAYFSDLVVTDSDGRLRADDGAVRATRFTAVNEKWVSITRPWHLLTTQSGSGNPHAATAEKGRQVMELIVERLAPFLLELSDSELDADFPF
ncbi:creatininase family protein [Roseimaritima ulvae]|uniref:Creatinine amidohydrolase n=1 Tax=Roseimaritima ulvae TaxID=980254 RepID=A0A5B9QRP8_9BACT|nr:creatininase family protein [Roseimaritima ulvae]QEG39736.1 Creatinine amidohydrolase [Roseimaritima ulvae]